MDEQQSQLDFDGTDHELQLRLRWAENAAKERAFWTPERVCLAWMQETTPDESDMRWWNAQPIYRRMGWLNLLERERKRMCEKHEWRRPFHIVSAEHEEEINFLLAEDEKRIERYMEILREDFLAGRPCSISFDCDQSFAGDHSRRLLREALERLSIPQACIQSQPQTDETEPQKAPSRRSKLQQPRVGR